MRECSRRRNWPAPAYPSEIDRAKQAAPNRRHSPWPARRPRMSDVRAAHANIQAPAERESCPGTRRFASSTPVRRPVTPRRCAGGFGSRDQAGSFDAIPMPAAAPRMTEQQGSRSRFAATVGSNARPSLPAQSEVDRVEAEKALAIADAILDRVGPTSSGATLSRRFSLAGACG